MQRGYQIVILLLVISLGLPLGAQAAPVGRIVQVEGRVDILKGGKLPTVPAKLQDQVEQGDVIRTKSDSKAQVQFVDDTTLTIAPETRVAIEDYLYDAPKGNRRAVVEVFRGLVHFVVSRILQTESPDFIMKTHTGVLGVRGTEWLAQLSPINTDIYNVNGKTEVASIFPEVPGKVLLTGMQFTRVADGFSPTLPIPYDPEDLKQLLLQFSRRGRGGGAAGPVCPLDTAALDTTSPLDLDSVVSTGITENFLGTNPLNSIYIPPPVTTPPPSPSSGPTISTYSFVMDLYGYHINTNTSQYSATYVGGSWGQLTGVDPEYFTTSGSGTRSSTSPIFTGSGLSFTNSDILSGKVSGVAGGTLTGTYSATFTASNGYSGTFSGPITINPNGTFSYGYTNLSGSNGTYAITGTGSASGTPGTYFSQTAVGSLLSTSNSVGQTKTITNNSDPTNGTYPIWGTRTGVYPGTFSATLNMTNTAPVSGYWPPLDQSGLNATMQGVVSGPAGGSQTGVMTTTGTGSGGSSSDTFAGPVTINPDGSLSATFYGTNTHSSYTGSGIFTQTGTWSQTAQAIPAASTYSFSIPNLFASYLLTSTSSTTASVNVSAFGMRPSGDSGSSVYPGMYLGSGSGSATGSFAPGINISGAISGALSGTVSGILGGYNLTGTGTFTPSGGSSSLTGTVTIAPNGSMTFSYSGPLTIGEQTYTVSGTLTQYVGIPVSQNASGTYQAVQGGSNPTLLNTGQMSGNHIIGSSSPSSTNASLALSYGNGFGQQPPLSAGSTGYFSVSGTGAVQPWYGGQQTWGMLNSTVTVNSSKFFGNPANVTYNPSTGNLTSQIASGQVVYGPYLNAVLADTPTSSGQTTTSFYQTLSPGTYQVTSSSPYSTGVYTNTSPLAGTMQLGGSGSIVSAPITANFNFTGTGTSGAFPASYSGTFTPNSFLGAVAGPATGTQTGWALGSAYFDSYGWVFGGPFTLGPNTTTPPLQATLTLGPGNTGTSPNGYPISVTGTWTQSDPPVRWTQTAAANWPPWLYRFNRLTPAPLGSVIQQAAQLSRPGRHSGLRSGPDLHRLARRALPRIQGPTPTSALNVVKR